MVPNIFVILIINFLTFCLSTSSIYDKYIDFNIEDEGFLDHDTLQVIGLSEIRYDDENKSLVLKKCLHRAETIAKERMVSIMIHTHFNIKGNKNAGSFLEDYPQKMTKAEIVYWSLYFEPLLKNSYIFLEQTHKEYCKVVLRIKEKNLIQKIKDWKYPNV